MKNFYASLLIILSLFLSHQVQSQVYFGCNCPCGWGYWNTGINHTFLFNTTSFTLDGQAIVPSSTLKVYVGAFYDSLGTLKNGGLMEWTGSPNAMAAWQTESGSIIGFSYGEQIQWKICIVNTNNNTHDVFNATPVYLAGFPNSGTFEGNGMSGVASLSASSLNSANAPDWNYTITANNHSILIPTTANMQIDGQALSNGDYLGVFFDSAGTLTCAGYVQWTGANTAISAWGVDTGLDGFAPNETFKWMIWQLSTGNTLYATATYSTGFPNGGTFMGQGISGLSSLTATTLLVNSITAPVSGCSLGNEPVTILASNPNPLPIHSFHLVYSSDGNTPQQIIVQQTIQGNSAMQVTLPITVDLTANGYHQISLGTNAQNQLLASIYNEINIASLTISGQSFCINSNAATLSLSPATAWVSGPGISGNTFSPAVAGAGAHWIHYGNAGLYNCPFHDSLQIIVHALPVLSIASPGALCITGQPVILNGSPSGGTFSGQGVTNGSFHPAAGTSTVSYQFTDSWGCSATTTMQITVQTPESIVISGLAGSYCEDDSLVSFTSNGMVSGSGIAGAGGSWLFSPQLAGPGAHAISFSLENGPCMSYDTMLVTVGSVPVVSIGNDTLIDANQYYTIHGAAGFSSYLWSNGATTQNITVNTSALYQLTVTNSFGCDGISNSIHLYVAPWGTHISGVNHSILIPAQTSFQLGSATISPGDFLGVFYDDNGVQKCGGWVQWTGSTTGLTAWGDDSTSPLKDGFADGESFEWKIYLTATQEELPGQATYNPYFTDSGTYVTNGISSLLSLTSSYTQQIAVPVGWSIFSSYISLFNPAVNVVFAPYTASVNIIKTGNGLIYWPQYNVNLLGNLQIGQGYQIHAYSAFTADFTGMKVIPQNTSIHLNTGWSIIGYLRSSAGAITSMLSPIGTNIIIVKNDLGQIYWPEFNLNMIGNMIPGEGYQIKVSAPVTFTFPPN